VKTGLSSPRAAPAEAPGTKSLKVFNVQYCMVYGNTVKTGPNVHKKESAKEHESAVKSRFHQRPR
jgi:hypothetical protein